MPPPQTGTHLASVIANLLAKKDIGVHEITSLRDAAIKSKWTTGFMELIESELHGSVKDFAAKVAAEESLPPELRQVFADAAHPQHQAQAIVLGVVIFSVVNAIVNDIITPVLQPLLNETWQGGPTRPLEPAEAALNELRGGAFKGRGVGEAAQTGINAERYNAILENTGEPPAIQEMLYLLRRKKVGAGDVEKAIRQSRVRDEWIPAVMALEYGPPSAGEALNAAIRNEITDGQASQIVAENGIDPANYQWLRDSAGRPPGIGELLQLLRRGVIDAGTVSQAVRESDIKDKYIPAILAMAPHLMPERTVVSAVRQGVLPAGEGIAKLMQLGFSPADAATLAAEGSAVKVGAHKQIAESLIVQGYQDGLLTNGEAVAHLGDNGFDATEAAYILSVSDAKVAHAQQTAAVNRVRSFYIAHRVDAPTATTDLVNLGVVGGTADTLVATWTHERDANVALPTIAVLDWALKNQWITTADYLARLQARGFSAVDAALYAAKATGAANPNPVGP